MSSPVSQQRPRRPQRHQLSTDAIAWKEHERLVAQAYQALGYSVTANVSVNGQQVDVVCEKHIAGAGRIKLYVECKYTAPGNPSVSKDEVTQFIANFRAVKDRRGFTIGVMVSNQPFSQYAQAAAADHPDIDLTTLDALETDAFGVRPYLQGILDRYTDDGAFFDYVELNASTDERRRQNTRAPVRDLFETWVADDNSPQLCLLGDFGAGKSTFFARTQCQLARRYLDGRFNRMPLLLPLREVGMAEDGPEIVERFFAQHVGTPVPYARFERFNADGRFVLLLDGFDEMAAASDQVARHRNYIKLCKLLAPRAKVAISCRPAYFVSENELRTVFDYWAVQTSFSVVNRPHGRRTSKKRAQINQSLVGQAGFQEYSARAVLASRSFANYVIRVELFDREQIREYLAHHRDDIIAASGGQLDDVSLIERIESIYDLEDLARRPILLKLIVESLPKFRALPQGGYEYTVGQDYLTTNTITPSLLYSVYTEGELTREYEKGQSRWRIDRDDRRRAIARIAYTLMVRERATIGSDDLMGLVIDELRVDLAAAEEVTTDIRSTSFLVRERNGDIRFSHKSFLEYFSAAYIRTFMRGHTKEVLATHAFSDEVLYFLGDILATSEPMLLEKCARLCRDSLRRKREASVVRQNAANILNYARKPAKEISHLECARLSYLKLDIDTLAFDDCSIDEVDIKRTKIANLRCSKTTLSVVTIRESALKSATFDWRSQVILDWWDGTGTVTIEDGVGSLYVGPGAIVSFAGVNSSLCLATQADGMFANFSCRGSMLFGSRGLALALVRGGEPSQLTNSILVHVDLSELLRQGVGIKDCLCIACSIDNVADLARLATVQGYVVRRDRAAYRERSHKGLMVFGNETLEEIVKLTGVERAEFLRKSEWEELLAIGFPRDAEGPPFDALTLAEARKLWRMSREGWIRRLEKRGGGSDKDLRR